MRIAVIFVVIFILTGCASMPDVTVPYRLARTDLGLIVTQTGSCTTDNVPVVVTDVKFTPAYSADISDAGLKHFKFDDLGKGFSKATAVISYYSDGRLKSVNSTHTSQLGEALPAIAALLKTVVGAGEDPVAGAEAATADVCDYFRSADGKPAPLTVVYRGGTEFPDPQAGEVDLQQLTVPPEHVDKLLAVFGVINVVYQITRPADADCIDFAGIPCAPVENPSPGSVPTLAGHTGKKITLREPAVARVVVAVNPPGDSTDPVVYSALVPVGQHGETYELAIQKGAWFGDNSVEIAVAEDGRLAKVSYGAGGSALGSAGALQTLDDAFAEPMAAEKAAALKAESDLIFEQQRLVLCRADPESCPK